MKNILIVILSVLVLTSCGTNKVSDRQSQTLSVVNQVLNSHNYDVVSDGGVDTISLVKVDSVIQVKNYPIIVDNGDTSSVKIIGHTNINLILVTVKKQTEGYSKEYTIVISHVKNKKPLLIAFTTDTNCIMRLISEYKLNDEESIKLKKQVILDNEKYLLSIM
jgi:uncharacterized DUF497 family protein